MAQTNRIKCQWCQETHTLSEGCYGGVAQKRARFEAQTAERYRKPVTPEVGRYEKPVTPEPPPVTAPEPGQSTRRGPAPTYASRAERQRAYRARKREGKA